MKSHWKLVLAAVLLLLAGCKKSPGGKADPTAGNGDAEPPASAGSPASGTGDAARLALFRESIIPLAVSHSGVENQLFAGQLFAVGESGSDPLIAFLAPPDLKISSAWAWSEKEGEEWLACSVVEHDLHPDLVLLRPRTAPGDAILFLGNDLPKVPDSLQRVFLANWDEPLKRNANRDEILKEVAARNAQRQDLLARYEAAFAKEEKLRTLSSQRRPQPANQEEFAQQKAEREARRDQIKILEQQRSDLRDQARQADFHLDPVGIRRPSRPVLSAKIHPLPIAATKIPIGDNTHVASVAQIFSAPVSVVIPGNLLARVEGEDLHFYPLPRLRDDLRPKLGKVTACFSWEGSARDRTLLEIACDPETTVLSDPSVRVFLAPEGTLPADPHDADLRFECTRDRLGRLHVGIDLRRLVDANAERFEGVIVFSNDDQPLSTGSFSFSVKRNEPDQGGGLVPVAFQSDTVAFEPLPDPARPPNIEEATLLATLPAGGEILHAVTGGAGRYLIVHVASPSRLRVADLATRAWIAEFSPADAGASLAFGADARNLYLVEAGNPSLRALRLPGLTPASAQPLPASAKVLAIAAAGYADDAPVLVIHQEHLELRRPDTLALLDLPITAEAFRATGELGRSSQPFTESRFSVVDAYAFAGPFGESFSLILDAPDTGVVNESHFVLRHLGFAWQLERNSMKAIPGSRHRLYGTSGIYLPARDRLVKPLGSRTDYLLPSQERGAIAVNISSRSTLPASPPLVSLAASDEAERSAFFIAGTASAGLMNNGDRRKFLPYNPLLGFPSQNLLVSVGQGRVTFEQTPPSANPATGVHPIVNRIPPAKRGEPWTWKPHDASGRIPALTVTSAPDRLTFDKVEGFSWKVPSGIDGIEAPLQITYPDGRTTETLYLPLVGPRAATMLTLETKREQLIPLAGRFGFPGQVDRILPTALANFLVVVSNRSRTASVIDLSTMSVHASHVSSRGIAEMAVTPDALLLWHLDGNLLESRSLPDLKPLKIGRAGFNQPIRALVAGHLPGSGKPYVIVEAEDSSYHLREINPETLEPGPPVKMPDLRSGDLRPARDRPLAPSASSHDGSMTWLGNCLVERTAPATFQVSRDTGRFSPHALAFTSHDGERIFSGFEIYNHLTKRVWAESLNRFRHCAYLPDDRGEYILGLYTWTDNERRQDFPRVALLDYHTREAKYHLDGLAEWTTTSDSLMKGPQAGARVQLLTATHHLVTTSSDGFQVLIRQLPLPAPE